MILIDTDIDDQSTDDVQDWLYYFNIQEKVSRCNGLQYVNQISINLESKSKFQFKYNCQSQVINSSTIRAYWYRRGTNLVYNSLLSDDCSMERGEGYNSILNYLFEENRMTFDAINKLKNEVFPFIGNHRHNSTNKLINLINASKCGLLIPETLASNDKEEVEHFLKEHGKVIVKNIAQAAFIQQQITNDRQLNIDFDNFIVDENNREAILKESFEFTLFQKYVNKRLELRIFFLEGQFFTSAIFSQSNELTKVDYRNYDSKRPNRVVPFNLPDSIKKKILRFMKVSDMNCGSIDMIYTENLKFYFLEVNPIGQFQANDQRCNFYIPRHIASILRK